MREDSTIDACVCLALHAVCHVPLHHAPSYLSLCLHRSLLRLPHSFLACTHTIITGMHTMSSSDLCPWTPYYAMHFVYTWGLHCTHMHASLTCLHLCPHRPLLCLPHSIAACTMSYAHNMHTHMFMSPSIDASHYTCCAHLGPALHTNTAHTGPCCAYQAATLDHSLHSAHINTTCTHTCACLYLSTPCHAKCCTHP